MYNAYNDFERLCRSYNDDVSFCGDNYIKIEDSYLKMDMELSDVTFVDDLCLCKSIGYYNLVRFTIYGDCEGFIPGFIVTNVRFSFRNYSCINLFLMKLSNRIRCLEKKGILCDHNSNNNVVDAVEIVDDFNDCIETDDVHLSHFKEFFNHVVGLDLPYVCVNVIDYDKYDVIKNNDDLLITKNESDYNKAIGKGVKVILLVDEPVDFCYVSDNFFFLISGFRTPLFSYYNCDDDFALTMLNSIGEVVYFHASDSLSLSFETRSLFDGDVLLTSDLAEYKDCISRDVLGVCRVDEPVDGCFSDTIYHVLCNKIRPYGNFSPYMSSVNLIDHFDTANVYFVRNAAERGYVNRYRNMGYNIRYNKNFKKCTVGFIDKNFDVRCPNQIDFYSGKSFKTNVLNYKGPGYYDVSFGTFIHFLTPTSYVDGSKRNLSYLLIRESCYFIYKGHFSYVNLIKEDGERLRERFCPHNEYKFRYKEN